MALPKPASIISALLLAAAVTGVLYFNRSEAERATQSTDDAYVQADFTTVAPQVSGVITSVAAEDNQTVKKGELLAVIEDAQFVVAVDAAKAEVASARAGIDSLQAHLVQQETVIQQAQAAIAADAAALKLASQNVARYRNLAADGSGTLQALQQAEAQLAIQLAGGEKNKAGLQLARQQVKVLNAELEKATAVLAKAQAAQTAAELQLSYTRITAPVAGTIGQQASRTGAFVNAGKPLLALVPLDAIYIVANFRETQLARIQPGQSVDIKIDALPGSPLQGTVDSLGPASGVSYSAVAPHNATGNFTKIVQRLPVRIRINPGQAVVKKLRVGMSVTPTIHVSN